MPENLLFPEILMARIASGDRQAGEQLYRDWHRRIAKLIGKHVCNHDIQDELIQESFLAILESAKAFDPSRRFTPWMYSIVRNVLISHYHRRRPRNRPGTISLDPEVPATRHTPLDEAMRAEAILRMLDAVERLNSKSRRIIIEFHLLGRTLTAIGQDIGLTGEAIRQAKAKAISRLYRNLALREAAKAVVQ